MVGLLMLFPLPALLRLLDLCVFMPAIIQALFCGCHCLQIPFDVPICREGTRLQLLLLTLAPCEIQHGTMFLQWRNEISTL
ncbi:hypothetical protein PVAP13_1NG498738 [Panicum virgatum]|uniref:Secreted protein n=1 Tax=Panicum virgatum TaxID=38727 RepID=A0A8T0XBX9_PANVG|nr:hypothetical protein PVAP13_1NG498738 [Panicum virgatum]